MRKHLYSIFRDFHSFILEMNVYQQWLRPLLIYEQPDDSSAKAPGAFHPLQGLARQLLMEHAP